MPQPKEKIECRMSNKEPHNDEVGGHSGPPYGDIKSEDSVGAATVPTKRALKGGVL
jgi:hypothetical protein